VGGFDQLVSTLALSFSSSLSLVEIICFNRYPKALPAMKALLFPRLALHFPSSITALALFFSLLFFFVETGWAYLPPGPKIFLTPLQISLPSLLPRVGDSLSTPHPPQKKQTQGFLPGRPTLFDILFLFGQILDPGRLLFSGPLPWGPHCMKTYVLRKVPSSPQPFDTGKVFFGMPRPFNSFIKVEAVPLAFFLLGRPF